MNLEAKMNCPNCNKNISVLIKEMIPGRRKRCSSCNADIKFSGDDGRRAQKALDDFEKSLKNMFK